MKDVCSGTGVGPTKEYYLNRPVVNGADDRGGAMALLAAIEVEMRRAPRSATPTTAKARTPDRRGGILSRLRSSIESGTSARDAAPRIAASGLIVAERLRP